MRARQCRLAGIADAVADLGKPEEIGRVFAGFQRYLYDKAAIRSQSAASP